MKRLTLFISVILQNNMSHYHISCIIPFTKYFVLDGTGASRVLCGASSGKLLIMKYLYQTQFALMQYDMYTIQDIHGFPVCPE